jgi:uncharacterized protein
VPTRRHLIPLSTTAQPGVSAEVIGTGDAVVVLAHGAGSRLDHPVHRGIAAAVADRGWTVLTFNFPYAEAGRRSPDHRDRLLDCYREVLAWTAEALGPGPIVAGGRSMGGRMASLLAAEGADLAGLVLLNYPLVGISGRSAGIPRVDHWPRITLPALFVTGSRDRMFPQPVFDAHRELLAGPVELHVVADADHSFGVPKRAQRSTDEVHGEVADVVDRWLTAAVVPA